MTKQAAIAHIEATYQPSDLQEAADFLGCRFDEAAAQIADDVEIDFDEITADFIAAWFDRI